MLLLSTFIVIILLLPYCYSETQTMTSNALDINDLDIFCTNDKYNNHLSVNNLYTQFNHITFPRSQYIHLDEFSLPRNYELTILTLISGLFLQFFNPSLIIFYVI